MIKDCISVKLIFFINKLYMKPIIFVTIWFILLIILLIVSLVLATKKTNTMDEYYTAQKWGMVAIFDFIFLLASIAIFGKAYEETHPEIFKIDSS